MNEVKKSIWLAMGVIGGCAALIGGIAFRNHVDVGDPELLPQKLIASTEGLTASTAPENDYPEEVYFEHLVRLLKEHYVEPVKDETKLALGSVRGMVGSLADVNSEYMDADRFRIYKNELSGKYEGIGVLFVFEAQASKAASITNPGDESGEPDLSQDPEAIPVLKVASVVPGGPADQAGVKVGDWVEAVDGRKVVSPKLFAQFQALNQQIKASVQKGGEIPQQLLERSQQMQDEAEHLLLPPRAKERLSSGTSGNVTVVFDRGGASFTRKIAKAASSLPPLVASADGTLALRFQPGVSKKLMEAITDLSTLTLDLRSGGRGQVAEMKKCLALLVKPGDYGVITRREGKQKIPFAIKGTADRKRTITLLVDSSTRGPAEIFALALSSRGLAKLVGTKTAGAREIVDAYSMPEGAGYTLTTGLYEVGKVGRQG